MAHFYAIARGNEYEYDDEELQPLENSNDNQTTTHSSSLTANSSSSSSSSSSFSTPSVSSVTPSTLLSSTVQGTWTRLYNHGRIAFHRVFAPDPYMRRLNITIYSIGIFLLVTAMFIPDKSKNLLVSITLLTLGLALTINGIRFLTLCYSSLRYGHDTLPSVSVRYRGSSSNRSNGGGIERSSRRLPTFPSGRTSSDTSSSVSREGNGAHEWNEGNISPQDLVSIIIEEALRNDGGTLPSSMSPTTTTNTTSSFSSSTPPSLPNRFTSSIHLSRRQVQRLRQAGFSDEAIASFAIIVAAQRSNLTILGNYESLLDLDNNNTTNDIIISRNGRLSDPLTDRRPQGASLQEIYRLPSYTFRAKPKNEKSIDIIESDSNKDSGKSTMSNNGGSNSTTTVTDTSITADSKLSDFPLMVSDSTSSTASTDTVSTPNQGTIPTETNTAGTNSNLNVCQICLEDYQDKEDIRILPCIHSFHMDCIDKWLVQKSVCPVCKSNIREAL